MATLYFNNVLTGSTDWNRVATYATSGCDYVFPSVIYDGDYLEFYPNVQANQNNTPLIFEFDNNSSVSGTNISVAIGSSLSQTMSNLKAAIESNTDFNVTVNNDNSLSFVASIPGSWGGVASNRYVYADPNNMPEGFNEFFCDFVNPENGSLPVDGNWYTDENCTIQSENLPSSSDSVVSFSTINTNSGSAPTIVNLTFSNTLSASPYFSTDITITGIATFNSGTSSDICTITGNVVYDGSVCYNTTINGDVTFSNGAISNGFAATGDVIFNDTCYVDIGLVSAASITLNDYSKLTSSVTATATNFVFNNSSGADNGAILNGDVIFNNSSRLDVADINGNVSLNNTSYISSGTIVGNVVFNDDSYTDGFGVYFYGDVSFNDSSYNSNTFAGSSAITCTGTVTFNDSSTNLSVVNGNVVFDNASYNTDGGSVNGNASFSGSSFSSDPAGAVYGNVTFSSATPVVFTLTDSTWNGDATSWIFSSSGSWIFNGTSYNNGTIGEAIFNAGNNSGTVTNGTFNGSSYNLGIVSNLGIFNDFSTNQELAQVNGGAIFNDSSANAYGGIVNGNAIFNNSSYNNGTVTGTATFTLSSALVMISNGYDGTYGNIELKYEKGINGSSILGIV